MTEHDIYSAIGSSSDVQTLENLIGIMDNNLKDDSFHLEVC